MASSKKRPLSLKNSSPGSKADFSEKFPNNGTLKGSSGLKLRIHLMPYLDPGRLPRFGRTLTDCGKNAYIIDGTFKNT